MRLARGREVAVLAVSDEVWGVMLNVWTRAGGVGSWPEAISALGRSIARLFLPPLCPCWVHACIILVVYHSIHAHPPPWATTLLRSSSQGLQSQ